jgi:hypothetical protein
LKLHELLDEVCDPKSFLAFATALAEDRKLSVETEKTNPSSPYGPDACGWENTSIENFLEAAIGWAEDSDFGTTQDLNPANPWAQFANFLYCGKIYE